MAMGVSGTLAGPADVLTGLPSLNSFRVGRNNGIEPATFSMRAACISIRNVNEALETKCMQEIDHSL